MTQTIEFNSRNVNVDLQQVLDFANVQEDKLVRNLPRTFYVPPEKLRNQITSLPETVELLQQAKDKGCQGFFIKNFLTSE
ncbi:MAG: hypothetical protein KGJ02_01985 [Verrucomicrobiota bacterium]|nr:hypothetical protein [Verrucomicrobiota bacterium]